ncbi:MAG: bacteriochlorophyll 4-vinyl reductase [Halorhodospira sp.]
MIAMSGHASAAAEPGEEEEARIGPNAILQVATALCTLEDEATARRIFDDAGLPHWLDTPPQEMVPESTVAALHQAVRRELAPAQARQVLLDAGVRTGYYVLQHRIPAPIRTLLRTLPPFAAGPLLLRAISQHAWTFVGSGKLHIGRGHPRLLELADNPVITGEHATSPVCYWHTAAFETLFRELVNPEARIRERECAAAGADCCRFELRYR